MEIKEKIAKLLALGASPNAHEAKAALLKAKALMIEHKLSLVDFAQKPEPRVRRFHTDITCSKEKHAWAVDLAAIIAKNYCCRSYIIRYQSAQNANLVLIGYEEDVAVCYAALRYAYLCIVGWEDDLRRLCEGLYTPDDMCTICNSYANGFIRGVEAAYKQQLNEHTEWGLVLVTPPEAREAVEKLEKTVFYTKEQALPNMYAQGYQDGARFNPLNKLDDKSAASSV